MKATHKNPRLPGEFMPVWARIPDHAFVSNEWEVATDEVERAATARVVYAFRPGYSTNNVEAPHVRLLQTLIHREKRRRKRKATAKRLPVPPQRAPEPKWYGRPEWNPVWTPQAMEHTDRGPHIMRCLRCSSFVNIDALAMMRREHTCPDLREGLMRRAG